MTGSGMAMAAGLNAYVPLIALGLLSRFSDLLALPAGWSWLESTPALVVLGVLLALTTHTAKSLSRPVVNTATAGVGAPVASTVEDVSAVGLVLVAVLVPVLVTVLAVVVLVLAVLAVRRWLAARSRARHEAPL